MSISVAFGSGAGYAGAVPARQAVVRGAHQEIFIPEEFGRIEESFSGPSGKTIVYIQDAHDSLEAQENIAKIISRLVKNKRVKTVFEEGYAGPVPTDNFFGLVKNAAIKEKAAYFLLDKLRVGGAEYAHINRADEFRLIGVEDLTLYGRNIESYRKSSISRKNVQEDLEELFTRITALANQYFPRELKIWFKSKNRFSEGKLPLLNYLKELQDLYSKSAQSDSARQFSEKYPVISVLLRVQTFDDPELAGRLKSLDSKTVFEEIEWLEKNISEEFLRNDRDRRIFVYYQELNLLRKLSRIELTQAEYEVAKKTIRRLNTRKLADFIAELTNRSLVLSKEWERHIQDAARFYQLAYKRDESIDSYLKEFAQSKTEDTAVLVFGGFHGNHIKEILRRRGFSYVVVSPGITLADDKHRDYYKTIMSTARYSPSGSFWVSRALKPPSLFFSAAAGEVTLAYSELRAIIASVETFGSLAPAAMSELRNDELSRPQKMVQTSKQMRSGLEHPEGKSGYDILIVAGKNKKESAFQAEQLRKIFGNHIKIICVAPSQTGGGQMIDSLRAYVAAKIELEKTSEDLDALWASGKRIAVFLDGGMGTRDSPLTQAANNMRGMIQLGTVTAESGKQEPATLLNLGYAQNRVFASSNNGNFLDFFYLGQLYIPSREISAAEIQAPFVQFLTEMKDENDITPDTINELCFYVMDRLTHKPLHYFPKQTFKRVEDARAVYKEFSAKGYGLAYSLGSFRIRRDFFAGLLKFYNASNGLADAALSLEPPDFLAPFLLLAEGLAVLSQEELESLGNEAEVLTKIQPEIAKKLEGFKKHREIIRFYLEVRKEFGLYPYDWFGTADAGSEIFWWRYRRPLDILNQQLAALKDIKGGTLFVDENGQAVQRELAAHETGEAEALRQLLGFKLPIILSKLGNVWIDADGKRDDTGDQITFEDVAKGIEIGGVWVKGSLIRGSDLPAGSKVVSSVVEERRGKLVSENTFVQRSTGEPLKSTNSLIYNVLNHEDFEVEGRLAADVFRPGIDDTRFVKGQTRFTIPFSINGKEADDRQLEGAAYSFKQLREMENDPPENEKLRNSVESALREKIAVETLINELFAEGYPREISGEIIKEHLRRLRRREPVDLSSAKWQSRLRLAVKWLIDERRKREYDYRISNIFGEEEQKQKEIDRAADEFVELMQKSKTEKGISFSIYSGGSGVGKGAIWESVMRRYPGRFEKFLIYTTRERRADENDYFREDIQKNGGSFSEALAFILSGRIQNIRHVNVLNVEAYREKLFKELPLNGIHLNAEEQRMLDKVLDLSSLGFSGKRLGHAPEKKNGASAQSLEISLHERLGLLPDGKIRVYGEFEGVQYYFTTREHLEELAGLKKVKIFWMDANLAQGVSFEGVENAIGDVNGSGRIKVLEATPEITAALKNLYGDVPTFFISPFPEPERRKVLVIGASGFLGRKIFEKFKKMPGMSVIGTKFSAASSDLIQLDVTDEAAVEELLKKEKPHVVIYAAAEANPKAAEQDSSRAEAINANAIDHFARHFKGQFVYISTDYVFDGQSPPYTALSETGALNQYALGKVKGEKKTLELFSGSGLIVRTGVLYGYNGSGDKMTFVQDVVNKLDYEELLNLDDSQKRYPVLIDDVAGLIADGVHQGSSGIFQIASEEGVTKYEWARQIADVYSHVFPKPHGTDPKNKITAAAEQGRGVDVPADARMTSSIRGTPLKDGLSAVIRKLSRNFKGGSFSRTFKYKRDGIWVVRKEAFSDGRNKLINEINWLKNLPAQVKTFFPELLDSQTEGDVVFYEMPFYSWPTLTHWILDHHLTPEEAEGKMTQVLEMYAQMLAAGNRGRAPASEEILDKYVKDFLVGKILDRIADTRKKAPEVFGPILDAERLIINGKRYYNIPALLKFILNHPEALKKLRPLLLGIFHGDLHFDNILVEERGASGGIKYLDPRGDEFGDPIYDLAKLAHTIEGKYDIHNYDLLQLTAENSKKGYNITIQYPWKQPYWQVYDHLDHNFFDILAKNGFDKEFEKLDPHWKARLSFTHAALFASDMPFHLKGDGIEKRAIGIYAEGVILLNNYVQKFLDLEILDEVDDQDRPSGRQAGAGEVHAKGLRHRSAAILPVNLAAGEIVFQKNSQNKLDVLVGHVQSGDAYSQTRDDIAARKLLPGIPAEAFFLAGTEGGFLLDNTSRETKSRNLENQTVFLAGMNPEQIDEVKRKNERVKKFEKSGDPSFKNKEIRSKAIELARREESNFDSLSGVEQKAYEDQAEAFFTEVSEYVFISLEEAMSRYKAAPDQFGETFASLFGTTSPAGDPNPRAVEYTKTIQTALKKIASREAASEEKKSELRSELRKVEPPSQKLSAGKKLNFETIFRKARRGLRPAAVLVDPEDFSGFSFAQKQEFLMLMLSNKSLRIIVYNAHGRIQDPELEALFKLDRVITTGKNLSQTIARLTSHVPVIHISKNILPEQEIVRGLEKRVIFFKTKSEKSGTLATALLWVLSGGENAGIEGVKKEAGFWFVEDTLLDDLQKAYDEKLILSIAA